MDDFFVKVPTAKEYRAKAAEQCNGTNKLILIYVVYFLIMLAVSVIDSLTGSKQVVNDQEVTSTWFATMFNFFTAGVFTFSLAEIAKKVNYGEQLEISDLFSGFAKFGRAFSLYLLEAIRVLLWSLLLIIPGIIKGYAYSMAYYIANENPDLSLSDCLKESEKMMVGYKWKYFCFRYSYAQFEL